MPNASFAPLHLGMACNRLLYKTRFSLRWTVLLAGLTITSQALAEVFGANASYSYSGFFADFQGHQPVISKSDAASTIGRTTFLPAAVGDESNFSGPLATTASATATAHASAGILGVAITGKVDATQARSEVKLNVDAKASLFDIFTVKTNNPANVGKTVHITNQMALKGFTTKQVVYAFPNYYPYKGNDFVEAGMDTRLLISGTGIAAGPYQGSLYQETEEGGNETFGFTRIDNPAPQTVTFSMDFVVGKPTPVFMSMELTGDALVTDRDELRHFPGEASFDADFSHTLAWGPVTRVTDSTTGEVINDWTIASVSGFNYGGPVPEPSCGALIAGGTMILLIWQRRRSRRASHALKRLGFTNGHFNRPCSIDLQSRQSRRIVVDAPVPL